MASILRNHYVLAVHDIRKSAAFYVDVMGFEVVREPPGWIFVKRDDCMVMLGECPEDMHPSTLGCHNYFAYLVVDDVDAYYAEVKARGAEFIQHLASKPWGMREFGVKTVDGHRIMVGQVMEGG
jgi:catechol 2,3-dioxygenase-like lactoylglutathione lyase family enzyme